MLQGWPPPGPNFFRWENGKLVYFTGSADGFIVPTADGWTEFWGVCDEVDIWSWPPEVGNLSVIDGLEFEIDIEVGAHSVRSKGQASGAPAGFGEKLLKVHKALQSLVGWHGREWWQDFVR